MASWVIRKIDRDLWQRAREAARVRRLPLKDVIENLLRRWLMEEREQAILDKSLQRLINLVNK